MQYMYEKRNKKICKLKHDVSVNCRFRGCSESEHKCSCYAQEKSTYERGLVHGPMGYIVGLKYGIF